jgi:hypothetical protein
VAENDRDGGKPVAMAFSTRRHLMTSRTGFVPLSFWYAACAALLGFIVASWAGSVRGSAPHAATNRQAHRDTVRNGGEDQAQDEAWMRHVQASGEWKSRVAVWQEGQRRREQAEREQAKRDRVWHYEPYRIANMPSPGYAEGGADVLGNVHRILENAGQNQRAYEQRVRDQRALGNQSASGLVPSANPAQSLDTLLQGMQRQQDRQNYERFLSQHR